MLKKIAVFGAALASAAAWFGFVRARALSRSWGIDVGERHRALPGDELVAAPVTVDTRSIEIAAPPAVVWPWLVQMGYGRAGWYSWDQLDMNHPSAQRIMPEYQSLAVGDVLPTHPGGGFEVKVLEPDHALVVYMDRASMEGQAASAQEGLATASPNVRLTGKYLESQMQGEFKASWAFVLEPTVSGTRFIERFRVFVEPPVSPNGATSKTPPAFAWTMLGFGVFVMIKKQMEGIRDRAEGRPITAPMSQFMKSRGRAGQPA